MNRRDPIFLLLAASYLALSLPVTHAQMPLLGTTDPKAPGSGLKVPQFDVASVKKNKGDSRMMRIMSKPDGFACENISLKDLIANAYGIKQDLISGGAGWVDTEGFDVNAKVAGPDVETYKNLTRNERESVLQALLAERFNLKVHRETKIFPTYDLVLARVGLKLRELPPIDPIAEAAKPPEQRRATGALSIGPGVFEGQGVGLANFAENLAYMVHRTVINKTGLDGIYNINLKWAPQDDPASTDAGIETGPSIFTALQEQLGLKLDSSKGPVDTLVIDHADPASEN